MMDTKSWNPFVGCRFDCVYCADSYKKLLRWNGGLHRCESCKTYSPHTHPERLTRIPGEKIIFVCSNGDVSFADPAYMSRILEAMREDRRTGRTWLLQSKNPVYFKDFLSELPTNTVLLTTIETNKDYPVSKAPSTTQRFSDFLSLDWPRKALVMEPILDFDLPVVLEWAGRLRPEAVFIGFETKRVCRLPEPTAEKVAAFFGELRNLGLRAYDKSEHKYRDVF